MKRITTSMLLALGTLLAVATPASSVVTTHDEPPSKAASLPEAAPDRVLAKFKPGLARATAGQALAARGLREIARTRGRGVSVLEIAQKARDVHAVVAELRESGLVEYAEPDYVVHAMRIPNDLYFPQQWGPDKIHAPEAWEITTGDDGIVVAVIDTGVDYNHLDLRDNMWRNPGEIPANGRDDDGNGFVDDVFGIDTVGTGDSNPLDDNSHGTHVAGTIGAVGNNGQGVAGVAWDVRIMALKFLDASGSGQLSDAIECLEYATSMKLDHGVNLVLTSNSWSGGGYSQALADAIQDAADAGILFVAAAGNSASDNDAQPVYPASYPLPEIVAVAATDSTDALAWFSNYGRQSVDLAAPGVGILSTVPGNQYASYDGTSMATPHVSGAAALLWARNPGASLLGVKAALMNGTDAIAGLRGKVASGGRLNAHRSLELCETNEVMLGVDLADGFVIQLGQTLDVHVDLRDCIAPALGASVTLAVPGASIAARDDGAGPDAARDDAVYTATWTPAQGGSTCVRIDAAFSGGSLTRTLCGTVSFFPYVMEPAPYQWVDTSGGANTGLSGDDVSVAIPIGFPFDYVFSTYTMVRISSNGYLSFGSAGEVYANTPIPNQGMPNDLIAPFWDDLVTGTGSIRTLLDGMAPNRRLVIEWANVGFYGATGSVTFQAILHEASGDIVLQYRDVRAAAPADAGGSASVGIEDGSGSLGLQRSFDQPSLANATAVAFRRTDCSDGDGDGSCDAGDNCSTRPNPDQRDSNGDGYGNACDADYDGNGVVGGSDRLLLGQVFGSRAGNPTYHPDFDSDADGVVGAQELLLLARGFGGAPGPSGLGCAGTVPCR